jgi:hypothetical protein
MRKLTLAALAAVLLAAGQVPPAAAEIDADAKIARLRQENPDWAVAVFDVTVSKDGEAWCFPHVILKSSTGKTVDFWVRTGPISLTGKSRGAVEALEPAVWTVARFQCYKENFNGAVAQMRLEPGEIVNLGHLIVDVYTVRRKGLFHGAIRRARAKVEDLEPEAIESLRKRAPSTYAKAKQRYFAINSKLKWHDVPPPQD